MIHLLDVIAFPKKKMCILVMFILSYVIYICYFTYQMGMNPSDIRDVWFLYQQLTHQMIFSIIPFLMGWLWVDLIHPHDRVFISVKHPYYLWDIKWVYVLWISGLFILCFYGLFWIIPPIALPHISLEIDLLIPLHLWLDVIILYLFSHLLASEKTKTLMLIFPLVYMIFQLLMQDQSSLRLYVILPLYQQEILRYELAVVYKLWYIGLGFIITRFFFGKIARNG